MGEDSGAAVAVAPASESKKRARADSESRDLERVAEIVMVLSAMGQMRGGRDPTAAEKALMAEARERLAKVCESVELHRRKDLFTKEMAMAVVVDHGLNPPKDNIPRPPKLSIAEKVANTKRKMEEAKEIAAQSSPLPSQLLHVSFGVKPEGRSSLFQGSQRFSPDKANSVPSGGLQAASSGGHVPALASGSSLLKQSQVNEVQRCLSPLKSSTSPPVSSPSVRLPEKTLAASLQATPPTSAHSSQANKVQHTAVRTEGAHGINVLQPPAQLIREQDPKTYVIQTTPGNQHFAHQLPHVVTLQDSSIFNNHNEISKMVQRLLPPKAFDQPSWTPPSTDYVSKPIYCQVCSMIINDVESLLVCDACERGLHMKCLVTYNHRVIPKAEWHCPKCLASSHGKPLPPKYGRVTRSMAASRLSSSTGSVQASLEKKAENVDTKVNIYQKMSSNGNPAVLTPSNALTVGNIQIESTTVKKMTNTGEKQEIDVPATNRKVVDDVHRGATSDHSDGKSGPSNVPSGLPNGNQHNLNPGLLLCPMQQQISECSLQTKVDSTLDIPQISLNTTDINSTSQGPNDLQIIKTAEVPVDSNISGMHPDNEFKNLPGLEKMSANEEGCDIRRENMVVSLETTSELGKDCSVSSTDMHNAEWVGDPVRAIDEKTYYQSCRINGVTYELQDHALTSSSDDKLLPSKIQALWEDSSSGAKWAMVHHCYHPSDFPEVVPRPAIPESDEVYESNKASTLLLESICGPCLVLPSSEFRKESERRRHSGETTVGLNPIFLCRWFYDETSGVFQCISH